MNAQTFLALVPDWGALIVGLANLLACMALPIPASLVMLAAGAFIATGDLAPATVWTAAILGAVLGDQIGYGIGRLGLTRLAGRFASHRRAARMGHKAARWLDHRRIPALFLSRWLVSALGPYINLAAGATRMRWLDFTLPAVAGELVWCSIYLGLGWGFARDIEDIGETLGNLAFAASAGVVAVLLGRALLRRGRD
ncbi:MAG: DedA family protein [Rhodobacteraceae bacterium PARR1]|nr:MAG: DedA family protein [Rhodobacteraceae bacterium PARR1]